MVHLVYGGLVALGFQPTSKDTKPCGAQGYMYIFCIWGDCPLEEHVELGIVTGFMNMLG